MEVLWTMVETLGEILLALGFWVAVYFVVKYTFRWLDRRYRFGMGRRGE